ncbi:MAG: universal stress protein [Desulfobacterales bacterium]|nr:universal stress protein [Desulfobacterales bacterium]MDD4072402.1 universal stress protein [Desulfobacterales bacterium]MDD4393296.1 universal stress protein [Desulfobacterales bacterium]
MTQKILVALDDSENAMRAVEFITKIFKPDSRVTLMCVLQDTAALCDMSSPELTSYFIAQQGTFCALEQEKKKLVESAVENARALLLKADFFENNISIKVDMKKTGVAADILEEFKLGNYDVLVMGRRGLSGIKEFFLGSISQKVIHGAKDISIMLVS